MSDVVLTPEDIVWYLTMRDLGPVAQDYLMQSLYTDRSRYLAPIYQTDSKLFRAHINHEMNLEAHEIDDLKRLEIAFEESKAGLPDDGILLSATTLEAYFCRICLELWYTPGVTYRRFKLRTFLRLLGYLKRSDKLVREINRIKKDLSIEFFHAGGQPDQLWNFSLDDWITVRSMAKYHIDIDLGSSLH